MPAISKPFKIGIIVAAVVLVVLAVYFTTGNTPTPPTSAAPTESHHSHLVIFRITAPEGSLAASISYTVDGETSTEANVELPWVAAEEALHASTVVTLTAHRIGTGTISCSIMVDGDSVDEESASGESPSIECAGSHTI